LRFEADFVGFWAVGAALVSAFGSGGPLVVESFMSTTSSEELLLGVVCFSGVGVVSGSDSEAGGEIGGSSWSDMMFWRLDVKCGGKGKEKGGGGWFI
jgi:hypothetical protein